MTSADICRIWNPETGIADLDGGLDDLSASEIPGIRAVWADQRERLRNTTQLSDFTEKLSREWAIETGIIENLYEIERGVTQTLIERGFQAELLSHGSTNKPRDYVIQLLRDQKDALDGVFAFVKDERRLTTSWIKELHAALLRSQESTEGIDALGRHVQIPLIRGAWKEQPNYPVRDGRTYAYCPPEQVGAEMDRLIEMHAAHIVGNVSSEIQAAWLHHRFTQIHPFQDGNGRVARAIASLVLVKDGLFPLVVTRDDKVAYLDSLEAADRGELKPLVDLIAKLQRGQFRRATAISEALLVEDDVQAALAGLRRTAERMAADRLAELQKVFDLSYKVEHDLETRLKEIENSVFEILGIISHFSSVFVNRSYENTSHYFRSQIIENARNNIGYFVDTSAYRSWVALHMRWTRRAQLVFAIHGIGQPFSGSLICAPFLEFKDKDEEEDNQTRSALYPVAEEGFVFFHSEDADRLLARFRPWREAVIRVALKELTQNL